MLYPSIDNLLKKIDSKYSLVSLAAKRARLLQQGEEPYLEEYVSVKPVGMALEEINADKLVFRLKEETKEAGNITR